MRKSCFKVCLISSPAKMASMERRVIVKSSSLLKSKVSAASLYSLEDSEKKTPLSSVYKMKRSDQSNWVNTQKVSKDILTHKMKGCLSTKSSLIWCSSKVFTVLQRIFEVMQISTGIF